ncbi:MAG TPA: hydroxymethylbilane synthase [Candidatus Acidoferrales bacterium]|nr:hydroxymethylbilane synthase [Candidatus Acidoferrales bacterium]
MTPRIASIRIGTRGSLLALAQARFVKERLQERYEGLEVETKIIKTSGDRFVSLPIKSVGGKGIFVKEIEEALLEGQVDVAIHSFKDLPTELTPGLCLAAVVEREDARDVCVSADGTSLKALPRGARVGTGSLRRRAQLLNWRGDLAVVPIRGNIDTRLKKLHNREVDCLVLAAAGLKRIGAEERITEYLEPEVCLGAVAQGALAVETRAGDAVNDALSFLHHAPTAAEVSAERAFLRRLGGGCHLPVAARAWANGAEVKLLGLVADIDGVKVVRGEISGSADESERLGIELAEELLKRGAAAILSPDGR